MSDSYIDLHSHTTESDGTLAPSELIDLAKAQGLAALAITDHDTFSGYEIASPYAVKVGLELLRGIELNSRLLLGNGSASRSAHMLAYFPQADPKPSFLDWLDEERDERRERNRKLAAALQSRGIDVTLDEVESRGRSLAGRTHFAQLLVEKGYAGHFEEAFARYLGESAPTHVVRRSLTTEETIERILDGGGIPVIAHPVRLQLSRDEERYQLARLRTAGLLALEVYHSDQPRELQDFYLRIATDLGLQPTGGSDFHGDTVKHNVALGTGRNRNIRVPYEVLEGLRYIAAHN